MSTTDIDSRPGWTPQAARPQVAKPQVANAHAENRLRPGCDVLRITSAQLFAGATEVHIEHHGALYRLKHTSLGKLILTK